jgi:hypothetical protein
MGIELDDIFDGSCREPEPPEIIGPPPAALDPPRMGSATASAFRRTAAAAVSGTLPSSCVFDGHMQLKLVPRRPVDDLPKTSPQVPHGTSEHQPAVIAECAPPTGGQPSRCELGTLDETHDSDGVDREVLQDFSDEERHETLSACMPSEPTETSRATSERAVAPMGIGGRPRPSEHRHDPERGGLPAFRSTGSQIYDLIRAVAARQALAAPRTITGDDQPLRYTSTTGQLDQINGMPEDPTNIFHPNYALPGATEDLDTDDPTDTDGGHATPLPEDRSDVDHPSGETVAAVPLPVAPDEKARSTRLREAKRSPASDTTRRRHTTRAIVSDSRETTAAAVPDSTRQPPLFDGSAAREPDRVDLPAERASAAADVDGAAVLQVHSLTGAPLLAGPDPMEATEAIRPAKQHEGGERPADASDIETGDRQPSPGDLRNTSDVDGTPKYRIPPGAGRPLSITDLHKAMRLSDSIRLPAADQTSLWELYRFEAWVRESVEAQNEVARQAAELATNKKWQAAFKESVEDSARRPLLDWVAELLDTFPDKTGKLATALCDELGLPDIVGQLIGMATKHAVTLAFPTQVAAGKSAALAIRTMGAILYEGPDGTNPFRKALVDSLGQEVASRIIDEAKSVLLGRKD